VATGPILIAVDGSPAAEAAIDAALELAAALGRPVTFLHADSHLASRLFEENLEDGPTPEQVTARDPVLAHAAGRAQEAGVEAALELVDLEGRTGDLAAEIAGVAAGLDASLIVTGSRGRGTAAGAVLGSVSHGLIKYATVPVLVVHARD
jgi:nucleotide-binding universal stress UspA family protein